MPDQERMFVQKRFKHYSIVFYRVDLPEYPWSGRSRDVRTVVFQSIPIRAFFDLGAVLSMTAFDIVFSDIFSNLLRTGKHVYLFRTSRGSQEIKRY